MTLFLLSFYGCAWVAGMLVLLVAAEEAPLGYEDASGFAYGMELA